MSETKLKIVKGNFYRILICDCCHERMSYHEQMHSHGICPHCGFDGKSTVCSTKNVVLRVVKTYELRKREPNILLEAFKYLFDYVPSDRYKLIKTEYEGKTQMDQRWVEKNPDNLVF